MSTASPSTFCSEFWKTYQSAPDEQSFRPKFFTDSEGGDWKRWGGKSFRKCELERRDTMPIAIIPASFAFTDPSVLPFARWDSYNHTMHLVES